ncbi:TBC20 protein, partial [Polypterus senegalus]|nr:TBC20 protein [Polypterus senegalus]
MRKGKKPSVSSQVNSNGSVKKQGEQASGKKRKIFEIQQALNSDPVDIQILRKTARTVGGLLTDDIRRKVWPKLLSINIYDLPAKPGTLHVSTDTRALDVKIVLHRKREVMNCDCDMASIHQLLSQIPQDLPYENLICRAHELFTRFPPSLIAKRAAHQPQKSITMSSFGDFQMATLQQRPDAILQRQTREKIPSDVAAFDESVAQGTSQIVKMAVWAISATLGATALAVAQTALDWAPEFLLQLF